MITFTFTIHPGAIISANHRMHWARKAALTRDLRTRAAYAWMQQGRLRLDRALCVVDVSYPDRRRRDVDNLTQTVKALIDGMVHQAAGVRGLLPDDSDDYLVGPDKRPTGVPMPGVYTLRLHFTELNPPASSERTPS